jgi:hypothetical protein
MSATAAYVGTLKIGANTIQLMQTSDLTSAAKMLDTTSLGGNGFETAIPGTIGGKIACKGAYDMTDTNGQLAIRNAHFGRTKLTGVVFSPDNLKTYTFNAWVPDYHPGANVADKATIDFTLQTDGAITPA